MAFCRVSYLRRSVGFSVEVLGKTKSYIDLIGKCKY